MSDPFLNTIRSKLEKLQCCWNCKKLSIDFVNGYFNCRSTRKYIYLNDICNHWELHSNLDRVNYSNEE